MGSIVPVQRDRRVSQGKFATVDELPQETFFKYFVLEIGVSHHTITVPYVSAAYVICSMRSRNTLAPMGFRGIAG
jgi:hypothetical protein